MGNLKGWLESGGPAIGDVPRALWPWMAEALSLLSTRPPAAPTDVVWGIDEAGELSPIPGGGAAVVFPCGLAQVPLFMLWRLHRRGCDRFFFPARVRWIQKDSLSAFRTAYFRAATRSVSRLLPASLAKAFLGASAAERTFVQWNRPGFPDSETAGPTWEEFVEFNNARMPAEDPKPPHPYRVALYIGSLGPGGAERQFCNLANGLAARGHHVTTIVTYPLTGTNGHYTGLLKDPGLKPIVAADMPDEGFEVDTDLLLSTPADLRDAILRLTGVLERTRPQVLHAWLDQCNLIGGIAALLAGVPRILLSTRNSNPTNFPRLLAPYMEEWYRILSRSHRVRFLANSRSGASSYASWIGIPEDHIHVVLNGFVEADYVKASSGDRLAVRAELGIPREAPVLLGIFRFDVEKQPDLFIEVARRAIERVGDLRVLVAGTGPLQAEVEAEVRRLGLSDRILLLGRRTDIGRILAAGDVLLLTSALEGSPNAVIEASHFGLPVVATAGGGTADAIVHGETGFLTGVRDTAALTEAVVRLFENPDLRERMGRAGPPFIASAFSLQETVDLTVRAYDQLFLDVPGRPTRVVSSRFRGGSALHEPVQFNSPESSA